MATLDDLKPIFESIQDSSEEQASLLKSFIQGQEREAKQGAAGRSTRAAGGREGTTIRGGISRGVESGIGGILGGIGGGLGILAKFAGAAAGLGAAGVGIAAFFTAIGGADAAIGKLGDGSNIKTLLGNLGEGIAQLDGKALKVIGVIAGTGALIGGVSVTVAGKAAVGMGAVGLGIGGFMAGIAAAGDLTGFTGAKFAEQAGNIATGIKALSGLDERSLAGITAIAAVGGLIGAAPKGVLVAGKAAVGMGAAGLGIGGFMAGIAAAGDLTGFTGDNFAKQATNVAEGIAAFKDVSESTLGGIAAIAGVTALISAAPGGLLIAGKAAVGLGAVGLGIGGFIAGVAAAGDLASWMGVEGDGIKKILENVAGGIVAFNEITPELAGNLESVGKGISGLGVGMAALFAAEGLSSITDGAIGGFQKAWNWFSSTTGIGDTVETRKNLFERIAEMLTAFNDKDFSGVAKLSSANVGTNLKALGEALTEFPDMPQRLEYQNINDFIDGPIESLLSLQADYGGFGAISEFSGELDKFREVINNFKEVKKVDFADILNINGAAKAFAEMSTVLNMLETGGTATIQVPIEEGSRAYGRRSYRTETIRTDNIDQMLTRSETIANKLREIKSLFGIGNDGSGSTAILNTQKLRSLDDKALITNLKLSQLVEIQEDTFELLERTFPAGTSQVIIAPNNSVNTNAPTSTVVDNHFNRNNTNDLDATALPSNVN